jgi:hypothetical protein
MGSPFSKKGVMDTFTKATDYNEWNVQDADTIGIFVVPGDRWEVAKKVRFSNYPDYDPRLPDEEIVGTIYINRAQIAEQFRLPIYSFSGADIVQLADNGQAIVRASDLYSPRDRLNGGACSR